MESERWQRIERLYHAAMERDPRHRGVYLLQVVMRGQWDARFFTLDHIQIEGTGKPIPITNPTPAPSPTPTPKPTMPVTTVKVETVSNA